MTEAPGWASPSEPGDGTGHQDQPPPPHPGLDQGQPPGAPDGQPLPPPGWSAQQPPPAGPGWGAPGWGAPPPGPGWGLPGWQTTARSAFKPGIVPLRPLGVGEILDGAISGIRANPKVMLGLSAIVVAISEIVQTVVLWLLLRGTVASLITTDGTEPSRRDVLNFLGASVGTLGITLVITVLARLVLTGILTVVVSRLVIARPVSLAEAWRAALPRLLPLLGLILLSSVVTVLILAVGTGPGLLLLGLTGSGPGGALLMLFGLCLSAVVAVFVWVRYFSLASPALVLEKQGVFASMKRSGTLVRSSWWRVFGILLLALVIAGIIAAIIQMPFTLLSRGGDLVGGTGNGAFVTSLGGMLVAAIGGIIAGTITQPFSAGVSVLLYVDQRMRREGLDIELTRAATAEQPAPTPSYPPTPGQPPAGW